MFLKVKVFLINHESQISQFTHFSCVWSHLVSKWHQGLTYVIRLIVLWRMNELKWFTKQALYFNIGDRLWYLEIYENCPFIFIHQVNGVVVNKDTYDWTKEWKEKLKCSLKAKTIISIAPGLDEFLCVYHCETTKEMWDIFQVTHEGTPGVKKGQNDHINPRVRTLQNKIWGNIYDMKKNSFKLWITWELLEKYFKMRICLWKSLAS